jgi:hypothetical protein
MDEDEDDLFSFATPNDTAAGGEEDDLFSFKTPNDTAAGGEEDDLFSFKTPKNETAGISKPVRESKLNVHTVK